MLVWTAAIAACLLAVAPGPAPRVGARAVLGWWHGSSTCVKADWNGACHDELVEYQFVANDSDTLKSVLHAAKLVQGVPAPMGDLPFSYDRRAGTWISDFANSRTSVRWTFWLQGDSLVGQVAIRPDMRIGRHVVAHRGRIPKS
jgi:hypothetical protein